MDDALADRQLAAKQARLEEILAGFERAIVAFSGGVDSTFLLKVARDVLGDRALGILAVSESLDRNESRAALATARQLGAPIRTVETREYDREAYRRNDRDRCYHCKTELFETLRAIAEREGYDVVLDGSNLDDRGDYRPGMRARDEQSARSPLLEAGLTKAEIRMLSRELGLPTWDKPAAPCLSSRLPYGTRVTRDRLRQVEAAEAELRALGFRVVRVRHHGDVARVEVPVGDLPRLVSDPLRERVVAAVKAAGFLFVAVDVQGFRSGALNETLPDVMPAGSGAPVAPGAFLPLSEVRSLS